MRIEDSTIAEREMVLRIFWTFSRMARNLSLYGVFDAFCSVDAAGDGAAVLCRSVPAASTSRQRAVVQSCACTAGTCWYWDTVRAAWLFLAASTPGRCLANALKSAAVHCLSHLRSNNGSELPF